MEEATPAWLTDALAAMRSRARLPVDEPASVLLAALVAAAADRCLHDDPMAMRREEALAHLRLLFDDMTQQSRILRFDAIHAPNVVGALERLCPLWPFCA